MSWGQRTTGLSFTRTTTAATANGRSSPRVSAHYAADGLYGDAKRNVLHITPSLTERAEWAATRRDRTPQELTIRRAIQHPRPFCRPMKRISCTSVKDGRAGMFRHRSCSCNRYWQQGLRPRVERSRGEPRRALVGSGTTVGRPSSRRRRTCVFNHPRSMKGDRPWQV
jgi:hypothetical protein